MTNDLAKMGNEELLDKFEEAARDKDYSHQRTVDDFWTLHAELLRRLRADSDGWVSPQEREPELTEKYAGDIPCRRVYFIRLGFPLNVIEGKAIAHRAGIKHGIIFYSDHNPVCVYYPHDVTYWKPRPLPQPPKKG